MLKIFLKLIYYVIASLCLKGTARILGRIKVFYFIGCLFVWFVTKKLCPRKEVEIKV
jgi:hypothetical protein